MSLEHRAPKTIQPEPQVWAQERGLPCWFGTVLHRGGGFRSGDPTDPESGAPAGTHEQPRTFPPAHAYKAGHPLPNNTYPHRLGEDKCASRSDRNWKFSISVSSTSVPSVPNLQPGLKGEGRSRPEQALASREPMRVCTRTCMHAPLPRFPVLVGRSERVAVSPVPPAPEPFCGLQF